MVGEDSLVSEADIDVCYTAEVCRSTRVGVKKMDYNDFLTALMKVSIKVKMRCKCKRSKLTCDRCSQICRWMTLFSAC